jgi:hypothetical protein
MHKSEVLDFCSSVCISLIQDREYRLLVQFRCNPIRLVGSFNMDLIGTANRIHCPSGITILMFYLSLRLTVQDIYNDVNHPSTYDHRTLNTRLPVRSAIFKQRTGGLVVRWVTTSEYPLLYVFACVHFRCGLKWNFCLLAQHQGQTVSTKEVAKTVRFY